MTTLPYRIEQRQVLPHGANRTVWCQLYTDRDLAARMYAYFVARQARFRPGDFQPDGQFRLVLTSDAGPVYEPSTVDGEL